MENIGKKIRRNFFGRVRGVGRVGGVWSRRGLPVIENHVGYSSANNYCFHSRLGLFRGVDIYLGRAFFVRDRGVGRVRGLVALEGFGRGGVCLYMYVKK